MHSPLPPLDPEPCPVSELRVKHLFAVDFEDASFPAFAYTRTREHAELIVRAVNNHSLLVDQLTEARKKLVWISEELMHGTVPREDISDWARDAYLAIDFELAAAQEVKS